MRKFLASLAAVVLTTSVACAQSPFSDVPRDHWAYDAVTDLAQRGLLIGYPDGTIMYTEKIFNEFWGWALPNGGLPRTTGYALMKAKESYSTSYWSGYDRKGTMQTTHFGVPWMKIPLTFAARPAAAAAVAAAAFSAPQQLTAGTYSTSVTLDASRYTIDRQTAAGFDLVRVEGLELSGAEGPLLPATELRLPLPADAQVWLKPGKATV